MQLKRRLICHLHCLLVEQRNQIMLKSVSNVSVFLDESKYGTKQWQEDQLIICNKCIIDLSSDIRPIPVPFIDSISLITSSIQTTEGLKLSSPTAKIGTVTATCSNHIPPTPGELESGAHCNLKDPVETSSAPKENPSKLTTNVVTYHSVRE